MPKDLVWRSSLYFLLILTLLAFNARDARAQTLGIGDHAPPIVVRAFIKGAPIRKVGDGRVTVVLFWSTWAYVASPNALKRISELADTYPKVRFLAVSVSEQFQESVPPFVNSLRSKINYTVALDSVPEGGSGKFGVMNQTWMDAARVRYVPAAFIVDADGRIQWIGLPINMDAALASIASGTWDAKAARSEFVENQAIKKSLSSIAKPGDPVQSIAALDALVAKSPEIEPRLAPVKFEFFRMAHKEAQALTYGSWILSVLGKKQSAPLNDMAWCIVDPAAKIKPTPAMLTLAMKAAKRAVTLTGDRNSAVIDTLACAQAATGDITGAIATEQHARKLAPDKRTLTACDAHLAVFRYMAIDKTK